MKKYTLEQLGNRRGERHISGAIHFTDGYFVTMVNSSISQIISYINTSGKEFAYFVSR